MKKQFIISLVLVLILLVLPGCKKFTWNPAGAWMLEVDHDTWSAWTEDIILTGNDSGGSVTGWNKYNPNSTFGTWTKTSKYTISITLNYVNDAGFITFENTITLTGTTTKDSPNMVTLTGNWREVSGLWGTTNYNMTVIAHKTSELQ